MGGGGGGEGGREGGLAMHMLHEEGKAIDYVVRYHTFNWTWQKYSLTGGGVGAGQ